LRFAFAKSRLKILAEIGVLMQHSGPGDQGLLSFNIVGIGYATIHRTNCRASLVIMKSDAFGTQLRVDDKDWIALANCIVGAFRFACAAINAIVGYHRRHEKTP
jgi:hypothetical protein